jgi:hypothetical protein
LDVRTAAIHTGTLRCLSVRQQGGAVLVRGSYGVPPGPDWGWTIRVVMHNIWPNGREDLAVEATYTRT